jgi:hypothetical protein
VVNLQFVAALVKQVLYIKLVFLMGKNTMGGTN